MKFLTTLVAIFFSIFCLLTVSHKERPMRFSYEILARDSLKCQYIDLSLAKIEYSKVIDSSDEGVVTMQKIVLDDGINYYKYNFANTEKQLKVRDAIEIKGVKFNIDSLYYEKQYDYKKPYIFSSIVNISKFEFGSRNYIAFFVQDISNPVTLPNSLVLLFDITEKRVISIPVGFQASEDLKCFNDFNSDGILDFAHWQQGYDFQKRLVRYELKNNKFVIKKQDFIQIYEKEDGYYVDVKNSNWKYGTFQRH